MSEEKSKAIIKQLTKKKTVAKESPERAAGAIEGGNKNKGKDKAVPLAQQIKKNMPGKKTLIDAALFGAACFVIYYYGRDIAKAVENVVPTEQSINDMMKEQQAQQAAMQQ